MSPFRDPHGPGSHAPARTEASVLHELCSALFASLRRSDQRRRGQEYLRGLLRADGRKSIRNIASLVGGRATEQRLHHFICESTWEWTPVRRALAVYLARTAPPQAWVLRPMMIPKAGEHSVGVGRRYCPDLAQSLNAQQAVGVWSVSESLSCPLNWRLHLSGAWVDDDRRRDRASIPAGIRPETLGECATEAFLALEVGRALPVRPVVLDARDMDAATILRRLRAAGVPALLRVGGDLRIIEADAVRPGHGTEAVAAHQIMGAAWNLRRPVTVLHHGSRAAVRTSLVGTVRVGLPGGGGTRGGTAGSGELVLLGSGDRRRSWPDELWLTDLTTAPPSALLRLSTLLERVDHDFTEIADRVGIRDFTGRSFTGWHRHVTLASAAHAVAALTGTTRPAGAPETARAAV